MTTDVLFGSDFEISAEERPPFADGEGAPDVASNDSFSHEQPSRIPLGPYALQALFKEFGGERVIHYENTRPVVHSPQLGPLLRGIRKDMSDDAFCLKLNPKQYRRRPTPSVILAVAQGIAMSDQLNETEKGVLDHVLGPKGTARFSRLAKAWKSVLESSVSHTAVQLSGTAHTAARGSREFSSAKERFNELVSGHLAQCGYHYAHDTGVLNWLFKIAAAHALSAIDMHATLSLKSVAWTKPVSTPTGSTASASPAPAATESASQSDGSPAVTLSSSTRSAPVSGGGSGRSNAGYQSPARSNHQTSSPPSCWGLTAAMWVIGAYAIWLALTNPIQEPLRTALALGIAMAVSGTTGALHPIGQPRRVLD